MGTFCRRFFFALLSLSRFCVTFGFLDRPLFAGLICSLCFGDLSLATSFIMPVAIFYEILWLDLFPAGTYVPPNGTLPLLLVLSLAYVFGISAENIVSPSALLLPLILAMPAADSASRIETFLRQRNDARYDKLVDWLRLRGAQQGGQALLDRGTSLDRISRQCPQSLIGAALIQSFIIYMMTFLLCFFVLFVTFWWLGAFLGYFSGYDMFFDGTFRKVFTWPILWFAALVGTLLALRIKKSYIAYAATVWVLFLSFFFVK